jgi:hypothetical protein
VRAALLLALIACGGPPVAPARLPEPASVAPEVPPHPLASGSFSFCHTPRALTGSEMTYCALVDDTVDAVCPGLRASCAERAAPRPRAGCDARSDPSPPSSRTVEPERPSSGCDPLISSSFNGMGEVLRWTLAILLALALAAVVSVVARAIARWRRRGDRAPPLTRAAPSGPDAPAATELPVELRRPSQDLLAEARAALAAGRLDDAVLLARASALRGLADDGAIALHPARTDREYVRAIAFDPTRASALGGLVAGVERARWGRLPLAPADARAAIDAAARLVGGGMVLAALLWSASPASAAPEHEPDGYAGLIEAWRGVGVDAKARVRGLNPVGEAVSLLFIDLDRYPLDTVTSEAVLAWVLDGGILVLAGDPPDELGLTLVPTPAHDLQRGVEVLADPIWPGGPRAVVLLDGDGDVQPVVGSSPEPMVDGEIRALDGDRASAVWLYWGDGGVLVVPDGRALRNGALVRAENVAFARELLQFAGGRAGSALVGRVDVVVAPPAAGAAGPLQSLAYAGLLPIVLQGLLALALAAWWLGAPFGPALAGPELARRDLADHARALGHHYRDLRAGRSAARAFAALWLDRLGSVGLQAAAERQGATPDAARALVARARALADSPDASSAPNDPAEPYLATLEELWTITRNR